MNESQDTTLVEHHPIFVKKIEEMKQRHQREMDGLKPMEAVFNRIPLGLVEKCCFYGTTQIDLDNLTRSESLSVIAAMNAGRWTKSVNPSFPECIDYETIIDGVKVRLWCAAPPDSCRIIEFEEIVPATVVVRRKLVCSEKEEI